MISGNVVFGPYTNKSGGQLIITDEGIHYIGKARRTLGIKMENVELDVPFGEIVVVSVTLGDFMIVCNDYTITFQKAKQYQEAITYLKEKQRAMQKAIEERKLNEEREHLNAEHVMRCNVCGKVFTYTNLDVSVAKSNVAAALDAKTRANSTFLFGSMVRGSIEQGNADAALSAASEKESKLGRCPNCNSRNVTEISSEEAAKDAETPAAPAASAMDELKKLKELLDMGIVT